MSKSRRKHIYIAYTGGTIGMKKTTDGYAPEPDYLRQQMQAMPELNDPQMPEYTIHAYQPLLDSSNMTPANWLEIAKDIVDNYDRFDGFIILHGTDTMAYTASFLPFVLQGIQKPVIITGSQIPLCNIRNDARENLITAMLITSTYPIAEVCLYFGHKLMRGCRAVKVNADGLDAFDSPNFPPLGNAGIQIKIKSDLLNHPITTFNGFNSLPVKRADVGSLRLFPGISTQVIENMLKPPLQGLVLGTYGVGNAPDNNQPFLNALKNAADRGVVIVDCTQCLRGTVQIGSYKTGSALSKVGVVSGQDMTTEAALTKLYYLFGMGYDPTTVKRLMTENLCGELTPTS